MGVELKVLPPVSTATTATTLLLLSSSTCVIFVLQGAAPHDYAPFLCSATALGALTGKILIGWFVRRTGKQSFLVWTLAGISTVSVLLMGGLGVASVIENGAET